MTLAPATSARSRTVLAALLLAAPAAGQTPGFDPPVAPDLDPDPRVVEVRLTASVTTWQFVPGQDTEVWAYNGSIPGPTIVGNVGDVLKVHFQNDLPEETTIHWHGSDTPASMDGSHISQRTIAPGEGFVYEFQLLRAGMTWYHPHVRPFDQVEKGLYGVLLVQDPVADTALGLDAFEEHVVVFDDVLLDGEGQLVPAFSFTDPVENALYQLNGRVGNQLLVNGRVAGPGVVLDVTNGVPQRWRVLNAANTTFCRLDVNEDLDASLWQIGTDGGLMTRREYRPPIDSLLGPSPQFTGAGSSGASAQLHPFQANPQEGIFIVPGERMDVVFTPHGFPGTFLRLFQYDWVRGRHVAQVDPAGNIVLLDDPLDGQIPAIEYMRLRLLGPDPGAPYPEPPVQLVSLEDLDPADSIGELPVTMGHSNPDPAGNVNFFVQAEFAGGTMTPLPAPKITSEKAYDVQVGETWTWTVTNLTHGDHPFHTHGFYFQPLDIELIDDNFPLLDRKFTFYRPIWKDTIRVPARPGLKGSSRTILRALVKFDDRGRVGTTAAHGELPTAHADGSWTSGGWLFHCHVLEHSGKGMLSFYELREPDDPFWLLGKATAGSNGLPGLTATGTLDYGSSVDCTLASALPGATAYLVVGYGRMDLPVAGGLLVPTVDEVHVAQVGAGGLAAWSLPYAPAVSGTTFYFQSVFGDPRAVQGLAFSNAVRLTVP